MRYDEKKLNEFWNKRKIKANWRENGWDGHRETEFGRDIIRKCGCMMFVGWGISEAEFNKRKCFECDGAGFFKESN